MNAYRERPNRIPWPPIILIAAALLSILAGMFYPVPFAQTVALRIAGGILLVVAIAVDIWSMATLRSAHTTVLPTKKSDHLVTAGPFAYSRNPIYTANVLLLVSLGLILANAWFVPFAVLTAIATHYLAIRREELHLLAVFGAEYESYCRRVRRWI